MSTPHVVVVMGVAGTGKTTIGPLLAAGLGVPYAEGDDFHPPANIAKMSAGTPLDDDDRWPWLDAIGAWAHGRAGLGGVVSSSALKRSTGTGCGPRRPAPSSCISPATAR